jgi:hypothetical protein
MEYLILLVFGTLCAGLMMVMYHKNNELHEMIKKNEDKVRDFEKYMNPGEHDSMIRQRMSNTETRVTAVEKSLKSQIADLEALNRNMAQQIRSIMESETGSRSSAGAGVTADQSALLTNQIIFVNDRVNTLTAKVDSINDAQLAVARSALFVDGVNVCVFAPTDVCPPGLTKKATFGIIEHSGDNPVPAGYYIGGQFSDSGWNWMHGGLCCSQ